MAYDDAIEQRLQRLRTKLLDLTTTNRMLSYRHPRASCLRVVDELPGQLFSSLIDGETFVFDPVPYRRAERQARAGRLLILARPLSVELATYS